MEVRGTEHIDSIAINDEDAELAWQRFLAVCPALSEARSPISLCAGRVVYKQSGTRRVVYKRIRESGPLFFRERREAPGRQAN